MAERRTDNTVAKRRRTDNTVAKRRRTDNTVAERRRTDNTVAKIRTDNTVAERKRTIEETMIYKTLHITNNDRATRAHTKTPGVNSDAPEGCVHVASFVLLL